MDSNVSFSLVGVSTDQFALISLPKQDDDMSVEIETSIGACYANHNVNVAVSAKFSENGNVCMFIQTTNYFKIGSESWNKLSGGGCNNVILGKDFIEHIVVVSIGTLRGVLHAKTEKTQFNKYFLPLVNSNNFDDFIIMNNQ